VGFAGASPVRAAAARIGKIINSVILKLSRILKKLAKPALIAFGILIIFYVIFLSLLWKRYAFNFFVGLIAMLFIIAVIKSEKLLMIARKFPKWIGVSGKVILCAVIASFLIVQGIILSHMNGKAAVNETEYLVILGCQVNGSLASLPLLRRGYSAINYLKKHENVKAVITGGQGPREDITEAEAMRRLLAENGIGEDRILIEDKARSTIENLKFANELYDLLDKNIVIVTSDYHMFRSLSIAKKIGLPKYRGTCGQKPVFGTAGLFVTRVRCGCFLCADEKDVEKMQL
jgi:uncharacterized SAM-binding protein YcdF (DUF218 family)